MGPTVIVVVAPRIDNRLRVGDGFEAVHVEALISESAIKTLDKRVLHRLAGPNEVQRDTAPIGPFVEGLGREFGAVIDRDRLREPTTSGERLQRIDDTLAGHRDVGLHQHTLTTPLIDDGQHPKGAATDELVVDEIHTPGLIAATRRRHDPALQTEPLLAPCAHPHLQALESVQAMDALLVVRPAFPSQHDPDTDVAKPWPRLCDLADPHAAGRGVSRLRFVIPSIRTDMGERTRTPTTHLVAVVNPLGQLPSANWP